MAVFIDIFAAFVYVPKVSMQRPSRDTNCFGRVYFIISDSSELTRRDELN